MADFLEEFMDTNISTIKEIGDHIANITKMGPGLGEYLFDKNVLKWVICKPTRFYKGLKG